MALLQGRIFYGWLVVLATFSVNLIAFGAVYAFGAFLPSLEMEFGATRTESSLLFAFSGGLYFAFGIVIGPLSDRWGVKWLCVGAMTLTAISLIGASFASSKAMLFVYLGVGLGLGVGLCFVPAMSLIQFWFDRRRGLASGIAVAGIGVGTLIYPLLAASLIAPFGWRNTYLLLGLLSGLLGISMSLLIVDRPEQKGLGIDGRPYEAVGASCAPLPGVSVLRAVTSKPFIIFYIAAIFGSTAMFVPFVHLPAYAQDHGWSVMDSAWLIGLIGIGSTIGRLGLSGIGDRIGYAHAMGLMYIGMGLSFGLWSLGSSSLGLSAFAIVFGVFYGGVVPQTPALTVVLFGPKSLGAILGVLFSAVAIGTLIGPSLAGYVYSESGSYVLPIVFSIGACMFAGLLMVAFVREGPPFDEAGSSCHLGEHRTPC